MPKIREFKKEDHAEVLELFKQLNDSIESFDAQSIINDNNCYCVVLEENGGVKGFGALILHHVPTRGLVGRLEDIIIGEASRQKGFGRKIVEHLIEKAKNMGAASIDLTSNPQRIAAHSLYESLGFQKRDTGSYRKEL